MGHDRRAYHYDHSICKHYKGSHRICPKAPDIIDNLIEGDTITIIPEEMKKGKREIVAKSIRDVIQGTEPKPKMETSYKVQDLFKNLKLN